MFFTYSQVSSIKIHLKLHKFVMSCKLTTIFLSILFLISGKNIDLKITLPYGFIY